MDSEEIEIQERVQEDRESIVMPPIDTKNDSLALFTSENSAEPLIPGKNDNQHISKSVNTFILCIDLLLDCYYTYYVEYGFVQWTFSS